TIGPDAMITLHPPGSTVLQTLAGVMPGDDLKATAGSAARQDVGELSISAKEPIAGATRYEVYYCDGASFQTQNDLSATPVAIANFEDVCLNTDGTFSVIALALADDEVIGHSHATDLSLAASGTTEV